MTVHQFTLDLPDSAEEVFAWHARPGALRRLLPPWQPVRVGAEAADLRAGRTVLDLPLGRTWVAAHRADGYRAGERFTDRLESRPFGVPLAWEHVHEVTPHERGSRLTDTVTTPVPAALLRPMFGYRHRQLRDDLTAHRTWASSPRLTVAVTGSRGLVGSALTALLSTGGHRVLRLVRGPSTAPDQRPWDPDAPDPRALDGVDTVVHLAGEPIAGRFTPEHRQRVRDSRVGPTRRLARAAVEAGVASFVSASAVGYYGADRGDEELDESAPPGRDFLAGVVSDWEADALEATRGTGTRAVQVRTGLVQSPAGGALALQRRLFQVGMGGRLGSGEQWQPWIGLDDLVDVYLRALLDERLDGPVNAVAPHPVRQREHARALAGVLHRPALVPTPALGPRLLLGRVGAEELALASQRVRPRRLLELGHTFRYVDLAPALRHVFGQEPR